MAHWIETNNEKNVSKCSKCGYKYPVSITNDYWRNRYQYCPHCGERMEHKHETDNRAMG